MQVESNNNYNTMGRMGPVYPRPEYRPGPRPGQTPEETGGQGGRDKVDVSTNAGGRSGEKARKVVPVQAPAAAEGRLNLAGAKTLTETTAAAIAGLSPGGLNQAPHNVAGLGLMAPRYV
ncbi:MAG: hypothetical protein LBP95_12090 [Deltaproteobacteria bacterium]|jgi:hypothetical protein|nr:hypothetical protein [Deltaproteobacteria bacterium]MDR1296192.1 hypothetical protein [Deltaproteobacteria bacterium]